MLRLWHQAGPACKAAFPGLQLRPGRRRGELVGPDGEARLGPSLAAPDLLALDDPELALWDDLREGCLDPGLRVLMVGQERGRQSVLARAERELGFSPLRSAAELASGESAWPAEFPDARLAELRLQLLEDYPRRMLLHPAEAPKEVPEAEGVEVLTERYPVMQGYHHNILKFFREVLEMELWERDPGAPLGTHGQADIARAILAGKFIAVRSSNKVGKTDCAAGVALWWCMTQPEAKALITAPTAPNMREAMWPAILKMYRPDHRRGRKGLAGYIPEPGTLASTGIRWPDGRVLLGKTADSPEALSGISSPKLLVVVDEASGVGNPWFEAITGILAGGGKLLAISNPTQTSGWFFDAFQQREGWELLHIDGRWSPNVMAGKTVIPGLAEHDYPEMQARLWGLGSQVYQARVCGDFPTGGDDQVISLGDIELARARWDSASEEGPMLEFGLDSARFGDDRSSFAARRGLKLYTQTWFRERGVDPTLQGADGFAVVGRLNQGIRLLRKSGEKVRVKVDATGGWGGSPVDAIRDMQRRGEMDMGVDVVEVQFGAASSDPRQYAKVRDELWFSGRRFFRVQGGALYSDSEAEREMLAPFFKQTPSGANAVEPKDATRKRIGRSPDLADACLLAIYEPGYGPVGDEHWQWMKEAQDAWPTLGGGL